MRISFILLLFFMACTGDNTSFNHIDIQGHRGARGLAPENSLPAFIMAAGMGVNTLEMDVVVSQDSQIVVSHEPYFSPIFCLLPDGSRIPEDSIINIFEMPYSQIRAYDCGSIQNPKFPEQKLISTFKPLLVEVIDSVESYLKNQNKPSVQYNIELKTTRKTDGIFHPSPAIFSDLVYQILSSKGIIDRSTIQSFDFRTLQYFHRTYPEVSLALLIENDQDWHTHVDSLGFKPQIYSPHYPLLSQKIVAEIQKEGIRVIPWTVNEFSEMNKLLSWGVDGIITDYPDRALLVTKRK